MGLRERTWAAGHMSTGMACGKLRLFLWWFCYCDGVLRMNLLSYMYGVSYIVLMFISSCIPRGATGQANQ